LATSTTATICVGASATPKISTIRASVPHTEGRRTTCFLVATTETRDCATLKNDPTFVKLSCENQAALIAGAVSCIA
jgi:hypothetical protein